MSKKNTMKEINEIRKRNMEKWTADDYKLYGDFLQAIFGNEKAIHKAEDTGDDVSSEEEWLRFKEWMSAKKRTRRGEDKHKENQSNRNDRGASDEN